MLDFASFPLRAELPWSDAEIASGGLLLHACCGPCSEIPLTDYQARSIRPHIYYFNPNIHPFLEWQRRLEALRTVAAKFEADLSVDPSFNEACWREAGEIPIRCAFCYRLRMEASAHLARDLGYSFFSTTLLYSPWQKREMILAMGRAAAGHYGLHFLEEDWRRRYREGQEMAKADGIYRQKYCACIRSLEESEWRAKILAGQERYAESLALR